MEHPRKPVRFEEWNVRLFSFLLSSPTLSPCIPIGFYCYQNNFCILCCCFRLWILRSFRKCHEERFILIFFWKLSVHSPAIMWTSLPLKFVISYRLLLFLSFLVVIYGNKWWKSWNKSMENQPCWSNAFDWLLWPVPEAEKVAHSHWPCPLYIAEPPVGTGAVSLRPLSSSAHYLGPSSSTWPRVLLCFSVNGSEPSSNNFIGRAASVVLSDGEELSF